MKYRYLRNWAEQGLGKSLIETIGWHHAVPRVGGLFPGISTPIPQLDQVVPSLSYCIEEQAERIASLNRPIAVLWSGGLDSSIALVALAKAKRTQPLRYTTNIQSFKCSSSVLKEAIAKLDATPINYSFEEIQKMKKDGWLFITGTHADSITIGEFADSNGIHSTIWDMTIEEMLNIHKQDRLTLRNLKAHWNNIEPVFEHMPFERTAANMAWWLDFTCCWSRDEYDMVFRLDLTNGPEVDYINFFGSESFQKWAMQDTRDKQINNDPKGRLKKWLNNELKIDSMYIKNLMLEELVSPTYEAVMGNSRLVAIDEKYRPIMETI